MGAMLYRRHEHIAPMGRSYKDGAVFRRLAPMPRKSPASASAATDVPTSPVADFEASLDALEGLVEKMEHGEMSLEESLAAYERGVGLYRRCQQALEQAELRVKLLTDPDRPDDAQPFPDAPSAGDA
jgi:exodeoxyribonuclease VII small subunit